MNWEIDRRENERSNLALELHDEVFNQAALLGMVVEAPSPAFDRVLHNLAYRIRPMISGLRPAMLDYGLRAALE